MIGLLVLGVAMNFKAFRKIIFATFIIGTLSLPVDAAVVDGKIFNAMESYRLEDDGTVATTFKFNKGSPDGPLKEYHPRGFIQDTETNAVWGMQFIWPFKAEYRIIFLSEDYSITVIGRTKRDYVWIMAREKSIPNDDFEGILKFLRDQNYDTNGLRLVPHGS